MYFTDAWEKKKGRYRQNSLVTGRVLLKPD